MNIITTALPGEVRERVEDALRRLDRIEARLKAVPVFELTLSEYTVLQLVCERPMRMIEIARKTRTVKSNMTQLIDRMQRKGIVVRKPPFLYDRRGFEIHPTPDGRTRFRFHQNMFDSYCK